MNHITPEDIRRCKGKVFVLDVETTGLIYHQDKLIGVGIYCPEEDIAGYMPTCHYEDLPYGKPKSKKMWLGKKDYSKSSRGRKVMETVTTYRERNTALPEESLIYEAKKAVRYAADDPNSVVIGHNLKFDAHFLDLPLYDLPCKIIDTAIMVHLFDSRLRKSLDKAEEYFLGTTSKREYVALGKGESKNMPWHWTLETITDYCVNDCIVTHQLALHLKEELKKWKLLGLFSQQMKFLRTLQKAERRGLALDLEFIEQASTVLSSNLESLEKELYDTCGKKFNWRSNPQLSKAIYDDLGIEKPENPFADADGVDRSRMAHVNKYNKYRTSSFILMEKADHPLGPLILEIRECDKLLKYLLHAKFYLTNIL